MRKILAALFAGCIGLAAAAPATAQRTERCDRYQATIRSTAPSEGALATLEHTVDVLRAALALIDEPCGAPYIVSTDRAAIAEERARVYAAWRQARENCLQITSGPPSSDSPCSVEVADR